MHEAFCAIKDKHNQEIEEHASRIAFLNLKDSQKEKQLQKTQELEQTKSRNFGMER
jgi:hypothetical protein